MIIQLLLVLGIVVLIVSFLRNRNTMRFQAGKKVLFGAFVVLCILSVIQPELLSAIANAIGVGRGADLLLYLLVVAFAFVALNTYLKFKDMEERLTLLARRVAITEAMSREARLNRDDV